MYFLTAALGTIIGYVLYTIGFFLLVLTLFAPTLGYSWIYFGVGFIVGILGLILIPSSTAVLLGLVFILLVLLGLAVLILGLCRNNIDNWGSDYCCDSHDYCDHSCGKCHECKKDNHQECKKRKYNHNNKNKHSKTCDKNVTRGCAPCQKGRILRGQSDRSTPAKKTLSISKENPHLLRKIIGNAQIRKGNFSTPSSTHSSSTSSEDLITLTTTPNKKDKDSSYDQPIRLDTKSPELKKIKSVSIQNT